MQTQPKTIKTGLKDTIQDYSVFTGRKKEAMFHTREMGHVSNTNEYWSKQKKLKAKREPQKIENSLEFLGGNIIQLINPTKRLWNL